MITRFDLSPQYDPHAVERPLYRRWLERGVFTARAESPKPPYVIVIPPPNVTAGLRHGPPLKKATQDRPHRFQPTPRPGGLAAPPAHPPPTAPPHPRPLPP